jgi:hypothetical protein
LIEPFPILATFPYRIPLLNYNYLFEKEEGYWFYFHSLSVWFKDLSRTDERALKSN